MNPEWEPEFLTREIVDGIHEEQINSFGGLHGVRDENALESAIMAAQNVYYYADDDLYEIAAAYAYHLAESQAYLDGNKRTGDQAAFVFLEGGGVSCDQLPEEQTYLAMIKIATHEMSRADLAEYFDQRGVKSRNRFQTLQLSRQRRPLQPEHLGRRRLIAPRFSESLF
jgi:death-on-curing protein